MEISPWIATYISTALFWLWVINWGGAEWLEGWKAWALIEWFAGHWSAEQLKLFALVVLIIETTWFGAGLFSPLARLAFIEH